MEPQFAIQQIPNGIWKENCYLIHNNRHVLVIDPGGEADKIIAMIEHAQLVPLAVLNTHAHYDHIGAIEAIKQKFAIPFYLHSKDRKLLKHANLYRKFFDSEQQITIPHIDFYLDAFTSPLEVSEFSIQIIPSPGHTQGSVCFLIGEHLFTGDTLFKKTIGRTDLPGGHQKSLHDSLRLLSQLPAEIKIYPGHGQISVLSEVLAHNPQLIKVLNES